MQGDTGWEGWTKGNGLRVRARPLAVLSRGVSNRPLAPSDPQSMAEANGRGVLLGVHPGHGKGARHIVSAILNVYY